MRALLDTFASSQAPTPLVNARFVAAISHALSMPANAGETGVQTTFVSVTTLDASLVQVTTTTADVCQTVQE